MTAMTPAEFEARYRADPDPWGYQSSSYERDKYTATLAACGPGPFSSALELGGSIGVFSQQLAPRCRRLTTIDGAPTAVAAARSRLGGSDLVNVIVGTIPDDVPRRRYDLVVASEILYYLGPESLEATLALLARVLGPRRPARRRALAPGGSRASVHRRAGPLGAQSPAMARAARLHDDRRLPARRIGADVSSDYELLVIGGGPAGLAAARAYRQAGGKGPVALVSDERRIPYNRPPLSKDLLRGEISESELALEEERWFVEQRIGLVGARAVALDPTKREVTLSGGRPLSYTSCLLAPGAEPKRLPVPGNDDPRVRVLRSLDDLRDLRSELDDGLAVVVVGSGFIGCEIAASLRLLGHPVVLASDEPAPNERRLGAQAAAEIAGWLDELGVELALGAEVTKIARAGGRLEVRTGDSLAAR